MCEIYDFILFENYHLAINHYKDVCLIAKMLKASGYTVAIADVFDEASSCIVDGVPHVTINASMPKMNFRSTKLPILRVILQYFHAQAIRKYLAKTVQELNPICKNLYAGSYHVGMSLKMLKSIPSEKCVFLWGLRSSRLYEYKLHKDINSLNCYRLAKYVYKHDNVKFFVSDNFIKLEFIELGISENRLVIRPERVIDKLPVLSQNTINKTINLLSIGSLRPQKRIEKILDALKKIPDAPVFYRIAGKADDVYEQIIQRAMVGVQNAERLNYRLSEEEYNLLISKCDFLVLCDQKMPSNVTNGTLNEALLQGKPVIAPNYDPYKAIIDEYKIGLVYDPDEKTSLCSAIVNASEIGRASFDEAIIRYQKTLLFSTVVEHFRDDLMICLNAK